MSTSTARMTIGSALGTINTAALTISSTLDAVGSGVGMLNAMVDKAAREQRMRHKADVSEFKHRLINEVAMARAQRERQVIEFCKDKDNETLYSKAHDELTALLKDD
ncbi:hypothetical protein CH29_gp01 [Achromobacter phage JWAlpha]|uniref:Uncharacterized protein n=1 Tax=Achromobacter phage JWAlpha TaxID=1416009 RepID=V9VEE2_9CAUD|nr:hypothetical protein CH29_gp01 [Achromobacter phage JWAlpha]AHC93954.1 hypothetical protein JJJB_0001 [Achromobacter phage JWAlpha]